jgi:pyruvate carboxylase
MRAASELHIRTVAVYTYEDRYSLHRYKADEAYQIGANREPLKPYLDIEEIIRTAKRHGVNAIHPGYGFLSENVQLSRRCREEASSSWARARSHGKAGRQGGGQNHCQGRRHSPHSRQRGEN